MKRIASRWNAALFGAVIVASLGFGAAQAFAAPQAPAANERACTNSYCRKECGTLGEIGSRSTAAACAAGERKRVVQVERSRSRFRDRLRVCWPHMKKRCNRYPADGSRCSTILPESDVSSRAKT
jgi:hypothetical protein